MSYFLAFLHCVKRCKAQSRDAIIVSTELKASHRMESSRRKQVELELAREKRDHADLKALHEKKCAAFTKAEARLQAQLASCTEEIKELQTSLSTYRVRLL